MCHAFSCVVTRNKKIYWQAGMDSHDALISKFGLRDDTTDAEEMGICRIEIVPDNRRNYPYLYPELPWKLNIDQNITPSWLMQCHKDRALEAHEEWKKLIYDNFNYLEARNPINPLKIKAGGVTDK